MPLSSPRLAKAALGGGDAAEGLARVFHALDAGRIARRPGDHEVVVHDVAPVDAVAVGDELVLAGAVVHEQRVGVAPRPDRQRLPGADRDHPHVDPGVLAEDRDEVAKQARLLGRGRRGKRDEALLRARRAGERRDEQCRSEKDAPPAHGPSGTHAGEHKLPTPGDNPLMWHRNSTF